MTFHEFPLSLQQQLPPALVDAARCYHAALDRWSSDVGGLKRIDLKPWLPRLLQAYPFSGYVSFDSRPGQKIHLTQHQGHDLHPEARQILQLLAEPICIQMGKTFDKLALRRATMKPRISLQGLEWFEADAASAFQMLPLPQANMRARSELCFLRAQHQSLLRQATRTDQGIRAYGDLWDQLSLQHAKVVADKILDYYPELHGFAWRPAPRPVMRILLRDQAGKLHNRQLGSISVNQLRSYVNMQAWDQLMNPKKL